MKTPKPTLAHPYARSHARLLETLAAQGVDARVLGAFAAVPRHWFVSEALAPLAYRDDALPIGAGQTTSRPSTIARMLMLLSLQGHERVLEIGAGSGFLTALLAKLAARVYALGRLVVLDVEGFPIMRKWRLVHRRDRALSPAARAFAEFVVREAPKLVRLPETRMWGGMSGAMSG